MRTVYESHQILQQALEDKIIMGWHGRAMFDPPTNHRVTLKLLEGLSWDFNGVNIQDAFHQASDYCLAAQKHRKAKETAMLEKQPEDVQYLHLRRFTKDSDGCTTVEVVQDKGGITLCYIKEGPWYKVGAAFCSSQDDYVEVAGEVLAKERLLTSPMYIHEYDWKSDVARRLTCPQGRQWYEHAVQQGYPKKWKLKEYKETWLKVTAPFSFGPILWGWHNNTAEGKLQRAGSAKL